MRDATQSLGLFVPMELGIYRANQELITVAQRIGPTDFDGKAIRLIES